MTTSNLIECFAHEEPTRHRLGDPMPLSSLMTLMRIRMGLPVETFARAVQPLMQGLEATVGDLGAA